MADKDSLEYRRCSVEGCEYTEPRGAREGDFIDGKFVCPAHYRAARSTFPTVVERCGIEANSDAATDLDTILRAWAAYQSALYAGEFAIASGNLQSLQSFLADGAHKYGVYERLIARASGRKPS